MRILLHVRISHFAVVLLAVNQNFLLIVYCDSWQYRNN